MSSLNIRYGIKWNDPLTHKTGYGAATFETYESAEKLIKLIKNGLYKKELKRYKITWHCQFTIYQEEVIT